MEKETHVAIITGGTGTEREVSLKSALNLKELLRDLYDISVFDFPADLSKFLAQHKDFHCAIPMMHGKGGEDGELQGFLETLQVPYLFSGIEAHVIGVNKELSKKLVAKHGVQGATAIIVGADSLVAFEKPCVIKPLSGGSSVATAIVKSTDQFEDALKKALLVGEKVMIEDFIEGDEFTVGIIEENGVPVALPVIAIKAKDGFFDYDSKYKTESLAEEICPAPINEALTRQLQELALTAHTVIGCRHMSRSDFIVDKNGTPWFLEINTIPGMTATSLVPKAIQVSKRSLPQIFTQWIDNVGK